ncbi:MAG: hypothetical protein ACLGH0_11415, partial [Thermoanaerobaculia bacterium]
MGVAGVVHARHPRANGRRRPAAINLPTRHASRTARQGQSGAHRNPDRVRHQLLQRRKERTMTPNPQQAAGSEQTKPGAPPEENKQPPTPPIDVKVKAQDVHHLVSSVYTHQTFNYGPSAKEDVPLSTLLEELSSKLPQGLQPFRDPDHPKLLASLEERRVLLLTSYREEAAYAAGHALVNDPHFGKNKAKRALFPTRSRDKERSDLELMSVTEKEFLNDDQILLIGIGSKCTFFDSILAADLDVRIRVCTKLEEHSSYIVLSVDEKLLDDEEVAEKIRGLYVHRVSHFRHLLSSHFGDRAADFEQRLRTALGSVSTATERLHFQRVTDCLSQGAAAFEKFLEQLEATMHLSPELRASQLRTVEPAAVFKDDSEVHRTAAFVAACFPELNQQDFDRLVRLLLGKQTTTKETVRQAFRRDGKLVTVREEKQERCADHWTRDADKIFRDCHLRTVGLGDGSWVVDFSEPYLRDELRSYIDKHHPWYLKRQSELLQTSGVLFYGDLAPKTVEGLVKLFVERAIVDPTGF